MSEGIRKRPLLAEGMALTALFALLAASYFSLTWRTGDEARYYVLTTALAEGRGYVRIHDPFDRPETLTPPLFPFLGSVAQRLAPESDAARVRAAKLVATVMYVLCVPAALILLRRRGLECRADRLAVLFLGLAVVGLLTMSCWCMADTAYLVFSLAALACFYPPDRSGAGGGFLGGLFCGLAYLSRAAGLSLAAAVGLHLGMRRRWHLLLWAGAGFMLAAAGWMVRCQVLTGAPDGYLGYVLDRARVEGGAGNPVAYLAARWSSGLPSYLLGLLPRQLFYNLTWGHDLLHLTGLGFLSRPTEVVVGLTVLAGWFICLRHPGPMEFYWPLYWLMVAGLPIPPEQTYYVFPLMIPAAFYLVTALYAAGRRVGLARSRMAMVVMLTGLYALGTATAAGAIHLMKESGRRHLGPWDPARYASYGDPYMQAWARYVEACLWIGSNSPPGALIACRKPQHAYVFSGRKGWRYDIPRQVGSPTPWEAIGKMARRRRVYLVEDAFHLGGDTLSYAENYCTAMLPTLQRLSGSLTCEYATRSPVTRVWRAGPLLAR